LLIASCLLHGAPAGAEGFGIFSPAFRHGAAIPKKFTCDRAEVSPPLRWIGVPEGTKSFVVIAEDPDVPAGSWVQWVLYDLPASAGGVRQKMPASEWLPDGAKQGVNEFGKVGYSGPCPPPGKVHHYWFRVYALDAPTHLGPQATKARVYRAMRPHILRVSEVMGTYERRTRGHLTAARSAH
jgi:hypothetical protein